MSELKPCPFHNCNTCGCYDAVDLADSTWNYRPIELALQSALTTAQEENKVLQSALTIQNNNVTKLDNEIDRLDAELTTAQEENKRLRESISSIYFQRPTVENMKEIRIDRCLQPDNSSLWAIRSGGFCLNKQGNWEFEPMPSSRTNKFYKDCRFNSMDEAVKFAQSALNGGNG